MKKTAFIILLTILCYFSNSVYSQALQEPAPYWTGTDINGTPHDLYAYLDLGYTVIIDISATWCGPCWSYHQSHVLEDLYQAYGPSGTNEIMVLFLEGDPTTNLADLNGTGANTYGDWTQGVSYPIIDDPLACDSFINQGFPTLLVVCPVENRYTEIWKVTVSGLYNDAQGWCPDFGTASNVGVSQVENPLNLIEIFPNPTSDIAFINLSSITNNTTRVTCEIFNIYGQRIEEIDIPVNKTGDPQYQIDMAGFKNGVYYFRLCFNNDQITRKTVVRH